MPYATLQDLIDRFSEAELLQIADRDQDGVVDAAVVEAALADASDIIDGYISTRCQLPLQVVPGIVKGWCCDITRARLFRFDPPDYVIEANKVAQSQLRDVQAGRMALQVAGVQPEVAISNDLPEIEDGERLFTGRSLRAW